MELSLSAKTYRQILVFGLLTPSIDEVKGFCGEEPSKKWGTSIISDLSVEMWVKVTNPFYGLVKHVYPLNQKNFWRTRITVS